MLIWALIGVVRSKWNMMSVCCGRRSGMADYVQDGCSFSVALEHGAKHDQGTREDVFQMCAVSSAPDFFSRGHGNSCRQRSFCVPRWRWCAHWRPTRSGGGVVCDVHGSQVLAGNYLPAVGYRWGYRRRGTWGASSVLAQRMEWS